MSDFVKGDLGSKLRITCIGTNGEIINLTGYAVTLKYRIGATIYPDRTMTVLTPATNGVVEYAFITTDLLNEGVMYAEIELFNAITDVKLSSAEVLIFTVRGKTTE